MSWIQSLFVSILPRSWAESMESDSRKWHIQCSCGYEQSIWDIGGIRWKAIGEPRTLRKCPGCGHISWHRIYFKQDDPRRQHPETAR